MDRIEAVDRRYDLSCAGLRPRNPASAATGAGTPDKPGPRRALNERQVLEIIPAGRTTLYRMEKAGRFPRSTYISPNRRVWFEDEIVAWQNAVDEFNPNRGRGKGRLRCAPDARRIGSR